ncbi:MAG: trehalose-6-phosphate synthase [Acidobacteriota bacterium]|nr:trehalose-6-phosphate synthase [Acidobacteriota bacterium]
MLLLVVGVTAVTFLVARTQVRAEKAGLRDDLQRRSEILAESLQELVEPALGERSHYELRRIVERFGNRERLAGVAIYDLDGKVIAESPRLSERLDPPAPPLDAIQSDQATGKFVNLAGIPMHAYYVPLHNQGHVVGALAVFHDATYIYQQSDRIWRDTMWHVVAEVLLIVFVTMLIIRSAIVVPISRTTQWIRQLRNGKGKFPPRPKMSDEHFLAPLSEEVMNLARSLAEARASAEEEARLRESGDAIWTAERLRLTIRSRTEQRSLFVVSNREPYSHVHGPKGIELQVPASGLVTALEPVLRACDGTWIAAASGSADRETVDASDRIRVPPDTREYTLRRVWLPKAIDDGYYYGFANEGLWPLCHIAHARPVFRSSDWEAYQAANQTFADAALAEMAGSSQPLLLVQDYHFALLPQMIKRKRPAVRVAIFWHIPWPNPEAFGICPWRRELLDGLLGADMTGFHTQAHCNNFLETTDQTVQSRIEWERFAVRRNDHLTLVRPYPISVDMRERLFGNEAGSPYLLRAKLLKNLGISAQFLGVGVDRIDYTKGLLERFRGVERFIEKNPPYRGKFTFVQIGAPSRTRIERYQQFLTDVQAEAARINARFQTPDWRPIILLTRHHSHEEILPYYRAADLCLVTSLHDGMNLVAKEFVAARDDEQGALILSQFTGASRELRDALIVNPYDTEQVSDAIRLALEMDSDERHERMHRLRRTVRENNIYRWAGTLITDLSELRVEEPDFAADRPN